MPIPKLIQFSELSAEEINDMPTLINFNEYETRLKNHDWFFVYSDDHRVWRAGKSVQESLAYTAKQHPIYMAAHQLWAKSVRNRPADMSWEQASLIRNAELDHLRSMIVLTYGESA